jgi:effector-binding domain-containing protein
MEYDVRLEQVSSRPLAMVRRQAKLEELAKVIPDGCGKVWDVVRSQQLKKSAGRHVALYWDDDFNLEVGCEMDGPFSGHDEVFPSATPGGLVATAVHFGPYNQLPAAHHAIRRWCAEHNHTLAGPNWEIYSHWVHAWCDDPTKIRTDVYYLLKADAGA